MSRKPKLIDRHARLIGLLNIVLLIVALPVNVVRLGLKVVVEEYPSEVSRAVKMIRTNRAGPYIGCYW